VAQSVKHPTLGFGSGHDLTHDRGIEPRVGLCAQRGSLLQILFALSLAPLSNK